MRSTTWTEPAFREINLSAEIGMYYEDDDTFYGRFGAGEGRRDRSRAAASLGQGEAHEVSGRAGR